MGGKGGDSGGQQQNEAALAANARAQAQADFAAGQQKAAASEPVVEKKPEEPKTDITKDVATTDTAAGKDNLTGLGDALVSGLSQGRSQQVADQTSRVTADPKTYTQYDPYTGSFVGQGPYSKTDTAKQGQV